MPRARLRFGVAPSSLLGGKGTDAFRRLMDFEADRTRGWYARALAKLDAQLGNADFISRAPADKVEELRDRVTDIAQRTASLDQMLEALS